MSIDNSSQRIVWHGGLTSCSFFVSVRKVDPILEPASLIFVNTISFKSGTLTELRLKAQLMGV